MHGKPVYSSIDKAYTNLLTDGNDLTFDYSAKSSYFEFTFDYPATIKKMYMNNQTSVAGTSVIFYDSSRNVLRTLAMSTTANGMTTALFNGFTVIPDLPDVKYVRYNNVSGSQVKIYEWDVWGTGGSPPPPSGLSGSPGTLKVDLSWNKVSDANLSSYNVYMDSVKIANVTSNFYSVTDLTPDVSHVFTVTSLYKDGFESVYSNSSTLAAYDLPASKPIITAEEKETSLILSWSSARAVQYYLFYVNNQLITITTDNSYEVKNLEMDKQYSFYVVAYDKYNRTTYSDVTTFGTRPPPLPVYPDVKISSKTFDQINMFWNNVGLFYEIYLDGNLVKQQSGNIYNFSSLLPDTDYKIQVVSTDVYGRKNASSLVVRTNPLPAPVKPKLRVNLKSFDKFSVVWDAVGVSYVAILDGNAVGYTTNQGFSFEGLTPETSYKVQVESTDQFERKVKSDVLTVKTDSIPPLDVPVLSKISLTSNSVRILWNTISGISNYDVLQDGIKITTSSGTFSQINDLEPSTNYSFTIGYVDSFGRFVESKPLIVTTLAAPLPDPTPGPPVPPPPVSKSSNADLNKANDQLVQGVNDTKESSVSIIAIIIGVIILVFFTLWIWRIIKRNMSKASFSSSKQKDNATVGAVPLPTKQKSSTSNFITATKQKSNKPKFRKRYISYEKTYRRPKKTF